MFWDCVNKVALVLNLKPHPRIMTEASDIFSLWNNYLNFSGIKFPLDCWLPFSELVHIKTHFSVTWHHCFLVHCHFQYTAFFFLLSYKHSLLLISVGCHFYCLPLFTFRLIELQSFQVRSSFLNLFTFKYHNWYHIIRLIYTTVSWTVLGPVPGNIQCSKEGYIKINEK